MVPLDLSKDNNQYCKISVLMPNAGSINESVISVTNVGGDSFSVAVSMIRWNTNKVFCKLINGTKISNINMYYTVDTERFCFYIKANWYAKIVVSRLGLVNTSKIESINAIPSEAIEVPIYWRDKRYSTDLGELIGINDLKRDATIARNSARANDSYYYNIIPSNVVKCSYLVEILEDRSQPKIYIVSKYKSNYKNDYNVKGVVVGSSMLSVKFFYNDNGDIILSIVASTRSSLVSVKLLCGDSMPSITKIETPSELTEIPIS